MGLSKEEQSALDALLAKQKEDDDDDFEIEIWSGTDGARVPYRKGKGWFEKTFGIDLGSATDDKATKRPATKRQSGAQSDDDGAGDGKDGDNTSALRHFQPRKAS